MRFRFCGDLDVPDWILVEIAFLSKITSVRIKLLAVELLKGMLGAEVNYAMVTKLTEEDFSESEVRASMAALDWVLRSAAKYDTDDITLSKELQQLGLPKENADSVGRAYRDKKDRLREKLREGSLHLGRLDSVDWRVDYVLDSSTARDLNVPTVQLRLNLVDAPGMPGKSTHGFEVAADKFEMLLHELRAARALMDNVS